MGRQRVQPFPVQEIQRHPVDIDNAQCAIERQSLRALFPIGILAGACPDRVGKFPLRQSRPASKPEQATGNVSVGLFLVYLIHAHKMPYTHFDGTPIL